MEAFLIFAAWTFAAMLIAVLGRTVVEHTRVVRSRRRARRRGGFVL